MQAPPLRTTVIGSYPFPGWLEFASQHLDQFGKDDLAELIEDATRIAYRELVLWMEAEYGYDRWDAYMMLSQCGRVRLGNFVDPKYTVGAGILKSYLV